MTKTERALDPATLHTLLSRVEKPARYTGNELNMVRKTGAPLRFALCFPDVYEIGMSHLGSRILYHVLNSRQDTYCERCFAPWVDMEQQLRERELPLFSLETRTPLAAFDVIGFSLLYEMCYTNLLNMLDLSGIPLFSRDRGEDMPLVLCGGPCTCNPEPLAQVADAFLLGDGEELVQDVMDCVAAARRDNLSRAETLRALSNIEGVYVPSFYEARYDEAGLFAGLVSLKPGVPPSIRRRVVLDLDAAPFIGQPIVPNLSIVHDRVALELFRGCTRGCRFCQAGFLYRPVRERSKETLLAQAQDLLACTGYDEVSLLSLSSGDYSQIHALVQELLDQLEGSRVSLSLPSLRVDAVLKKELERMQSVRKAGLTFAPEAGTQRLRDVVNKGVTEQDLLQSVRDAFLAGWSSVKLYFMLGLPTETDEDVLGIADLVKKVAGEYYAIPRQNRPRGLKISVSASCFVPKPFTPFQWCAQDSVEEFRRKQQLLKGALRGVKAADYRYHAPDLSVLEAVFSRGDRRLGPVLVEAFARGCRMDSWSECFRPDSWQEAFAACGVNPAQYAHRQRELAEPLPWDHLDMLVTKAYLSREYARALSGQVTQDCRQRCNGCFGEEYAHYCQV